MGDTPAGFQPPPAQHPPVQTPPPPRSMQSAAGTDSVLLDSGRDGGPVLSVSGNKYFFFDVRANERGEYLRIKEVRQMEHQEGRRDGKGW